MVAVRAADSAFVLVSVAEELAQFDPNKTAELIVG
jgi:hypothetical protein